MQERQPNGSVVVLGAKPLIYKTGQWLDTNKTERQHGLDPTQTHDSITRN
jgi:hypothetical protein